MEAGSILRSILIHLKTEVWTWGIIIHYLYFLLFLISRYIYLNHNVAVLTKHNLLIFASLPLFPLFLIPFYPPCLVTIPPSTNSSFPDGLLKITYWLVEDEDFRNYWPTEFILHPYTHIVNISIYLFLQQIFEMALTTGKVHCFVH